MSGSTMFWIVLAVVVVVALALLAAWLLRRGSSGRSLRETGDRALARVIKVEALEAPVGDGDVRSSIGFQLEPLAGGRPFDRHKTMTLSQGRLPRLGDVWPAWYRSTDPAAFDVEPLDPDDAGQAGIFSEFGLRHPGRAPQPVSPQPPDPAAAQDRPTVTGTSSSGRPDADRIGARPAPAQGDGPAAARGQAPGGPTAGAAEAMPAPQTPTAGTAPQDDPVIELERLIRLHDNGSLTDEEFAAAKAKYLQG